MWERAGFMGERWAAALDRENPALYPLGGQDVLFLLQPVRPRRPTANNLNNQI